MYTGNAYMYAGDSLMYGGDYSICVEECQI